MADWLEGRRETEKITRNGEIAVKQRSLPLSMFSILRSLIQPALRALGLLLADGALTVGWGKTFWWIGGVPSQKQA